jgi:hypothetical protein
MGCGEGEHAWANAGEVALCVRCGVWRAPKPAQDAPGSAEGREVAGVRTRRSWTALERRLVCGRTGGDERTFDRWAKGEAVREINAYRIEKAIEELKREGKIR